MQLILKYCQLFTSLMDQAGIRNGITWYYTSTAQYRLAVWCSGNALVSINAVALHRALLVLGWVTAFGQVNYLIT